jgi:hypothetical protein
MFLRATIVLSLLALSALSSCSSVGHKVEEEKARRVTALYEDKDHSKKCLAAFDQLRKKLKVGMTSTRASAALGNTKWLEHIHTDEIMFVSGSISVDIFPEGTWAFPVEAYVMSLYPNADNWSNYMAYFSLSLPEGYQSKFTIEDFLRGKVKSSGVKIHQFALCHPGKSPVDLGKTEIFGRSYRREF